MYWYTLSCNSFSYYVLSCIAIYQTTCTGTTTYIPLKNIEFMNTCIGMYWTVLACNVMYCHISSCITMYSSTCTVILDGLLLFLSVCFCFRPNHPSHESSSYSILKMTKRSSVMFFEIRENFCRIFNSMGAPRKPPSMIAPPLVRIFVLTLTFDALSFFLYIFVCIFILTVTSSHDNTSQCGPIHMDVDAWLPCYSTYQYSNQPMI